jgi:perosamine synthetase
VFPSNRLETGNWELLVSMASGSGDRPLEELKESLAKLTDRTSIFFAPSCRAALAHLVSVLPQEEVVIPAYTCPVVRDAMKIAGKKIIYVDIAPGSLNATAEQFAEHAGPGRVLVPTHLFGVPTDIEAINRLARERGSVTIEDAAAAFSARRDGQLLGTFSDFGVFSFERSKRLPAFRGAIIVVNNESLIDSSTLSNYRLTATRKVFPLRETARAMIYNLATIPSVYGRFTAPVRGYARHVEPDMDSITEELKTPFYSHAFHPYQATLVNRMLDRMDRIRDRVASLVKVYCEVLEGTAVQILVPQERDDGALLRFPIAVPDGTRDDFLRRALGYGLFLETNYERILAEPASSHSQFPNSLWAADNVVLLPLYSRMSENDARRIAQGVAEVANDLG